MQLHESCSRFLSHPDWQSHRWDIKDSVILNNWLEKVSIAIIASLIQFINFNLLVFHLACLYCCWNSRAVVFYFHAVTSVGQKSLILYKGYTDNHLAKECTLCMWSFYLTHSCVTKHRFNAWSPSHGGCNHCARRLTVEGSKKWSNEAKWGHPYCYAVARLLLLLSLSLFFYLSFLSSLLQFLLPPTTSLHPLFHARWGKMYAGAQVEGGGGRNQ